MKLFIAAVLIMLAIGTSSAQANCTTHRCWQRVHVHRLERLVEKRIAAIAPYRCYGHRSVKPCWVITQESATSGFWRAWNGQTCGNSGYHARGLYQLCGHGEPWPVIVTWGRKLWRHYETLKRELAHHRIARGLDLSNW